MSPAAAIKDHFKDWYLGTQPGDYVSMGVISEGQYGVPKGMCFSMPCMTKNFEFEIPKIENDNFVKNKLLRSVEEIYRDLSLVGFKL